jgi:glutamine amidotransferase
MRCERLGAVTRITDDPATIDAAERVVLPGVGAAGHAMARIDALGLRDTLQRRDRPMLGICLGMQLLFERSEEDDTTASASSRARCGSSSRRRPAGAAHGLEPARVRDDGAG